MFRFPKVGYLGPSVTTLFLLASVSGVCAEPKPSVADSPAYIYSESGPFGVLRYQVHEIGQSFEALVERSRIEVGNYNPTDQVKESTRTIWSIERTDGEVSDIRRRLDKLTSQLGESPERDIRLETKIRRERESLAGSFSRWTAGASEALRLLEGYNSRGFQGRHVDKAGSLDRKRKQIVADYLAAFEDSDVRRIDVQASFVGRRAVSLRMEITDHMLGTFAIHRSATATIPGYTRWMDMARDEMEAVSRYRDLRDPSTPRRNGVVNLLVTKEGKAGTTYDTFEEIAPLISGETVSIFTQWRRTVEDLGRRGGLLIDSRTHVEDVWSHIQDLSDRWFSGER